MEKDASLFGKRVVFLYPVPVVNELTTVLANKEFAACVSHDHERLQAFLAKDDRSLVFINIDDGMKESEWPAWILGAQEKNAKNAFGVLTLNGNPDLAKKYILDIGVQCGFITIKTGIAQATDILIKTLDANEARGRRKYVRATCEPESATFNTKEGFEQTSGTLLDISTAGSAFRFEDGRTLPKGRLLRDVQLKLRTIRLSLDIIIMGGHQEEDSNHILVGMFAPPSLDDSKLEKIRGFIKRCIQENFDQCLQGLV